MPTYRDEAVVLRTYPLGEADRIVVLLTRTHGKLRAVAKGVRRTSSKIGGRLEPGNHVDVQLATGRGSLDVVTQLEGLHVFSFAADYPCFTAAQVLLETADRLAAEERTPMTAHYRLLLGALLALGRGDLAGETIVDSYLLRALATSGYAMAIATCAACGAGQDRGWFAAGLGGVLCDRCRPAAASRVDAELLAYLGALLAGDWSATGVETGVRRRGSGIIATFAQWQLDRELKSLPFLVRS
ncbi:MAG: DNA repair protein RecO [Propionibacteriaceae bacterium]|nr:DNA repair protein RecO [Propionibacteriaceae bacterium]